MLIIISILITISTNSWLITWIALEINLLVFIPLIIKKNRKYQTEASIKYFLTQALASILILIRIYFLKTNEIFNIIIILALIIKIAAAPLHQWIPSLVKGLTWQILWLLLILQKINPLILLSINKQRAAINYILFIFISIRAIVGSIRGLIINNLKKILAYSSIAQLSWLISRILIKQFIWVVYFVIYRTILSSIIISIKEINIKNINQLFNKKNNTKNIFVSLSILSIAGLPPFSGFFIKFIIIITIIQTTFKFILIPLILSSLIRLFFYLRIRLTSIVSSSRKSIITKEKKINIFSITFINTVALRIGGLIFIFILDFKLYKLKTFKVLKKTQS